MWCLGFAEAAVGAIAHSGTAPGWLLCLVAVCMLGLVLWVYLHMYTIYPGFLTISGRDAVELAKYRMLIENIESLDKLDRRILDAVLRASDAPDPKDIQ